MEHIYDYPAFDIDLGLYILYAKWNRKKMLCNSNDSLDLIHIFIKRTKKLKDGKKQSCFGMV